MLDCKADAGFFRGKSACNVFTGAHRPYLSGIGVARFACFRLVLEISDGISDWYWGDVRLGPGLAGLKPQALGSGKYCGFSHVIQVYAPRIVGMTVQKRLPRALMP